MVKYTVDVPQGGGCSHPPIPELIGTGPNCNPKQSPAAKNPVQGDAAASPAKKTGTSNDNSKQKCLQEVQNRITKNFNEGVVTQNNKEAEAENAYLDGFFNMCAKKHISFCPITYPEHVHVKQEMILRDAIATYTLIAAGDNTAEGCACTNTETEPDCECLIPEGQRLDGGPAYKTGTKDANGNCICEEEPCDCEVPEPEKEECQEHTPSSDCADEEEGDCVQQIVSEPGINYGYLSNIRSYEDIDDNTPNCGENSPSEVWQIDPHKTCVGTRCPDEEEKGDTGDDSPPETYPGTWREARCECDEEDEKDEDERYTSQLPSKEPEDITPEELPSIDNLSGGESLIDLLPSSTVSQFEFPIENIFGRHFVAGNIFWVEKYNTLLTVELTNKVDLSTFFGSPELFGSGQVTEAQIEKRDIRFAVGLAVAGIDHISRVWSQGSLVFDATEPASTTNTIEAYYGGPSAKVSRRMARTHGFGRTPAYRDITYLVLDAENVDTEIPDVRVELISDTETQVTIVSSSTPVSSPEAVTDDRFLIDYNQQKIFQSMTNGRLRVVDYVTLEEIEIIQFPVNTHLDTLTVGNSVEYFMAQYPSNSSLRPYIDVFFDKQGQAIYSPHTDFPTEHYDPSHTNSQYSKYEFDTRTQTRRSQPLVHEVIQGISYLVQSAGGGIHTRETNDLYMFHRDMGATSTAYTRPAQTLNLVSSVKFRFDVGDMYITGFIGVAGNKDAPSSDDRAPIHIGTNIIRAGDKSIASNYRSDDYVVTPIQSDELGIYAEDVEVKGTLLDGNDLIIFATYGSATKDFIVKWNMVDGVQWVTPFSDTLPKLGENTEVVQRLTFDFLGAGSVPILYRIDLATGTTTTITDIPPISGYSNVTSPIMRYDSEFDSFSYYSTDNKFVNIFPAKQVEKTPTFKNVFGHIQTNMGDRGIPIELDGDDTPCEGFRTGSLLSWANILENMAITYDVNMFEDEFISAQKKQSGTAHDYPNTGIAYQNRETSITAQAGVVTVKFYDANNLGSFGAVQVYDPYLHEVKNNKTDYGFVSGGLMDTAYATQLAESLLYGRNNKATIEINSVVGSRGLLVVPGENVLGPYTALAISTTRNKIGVKGDNRFVKVVDVPETPIVVDTQLNAFKEATPHAKPLIIRPPLMPPYKSGFHSGNVGYQAGIIEVPTRAPEQIISETGETLTRRIQWGRSISVLGAVRNPFTTDYDNEITVLFDSPPETIPVDRTLNELLQDDTINVLACGNETVQFMTATKHLTDDRVYTFSGLLRGRFGTEENDLEHMINEVCVLNDSTQTRFTNIPVVDTAIFQNMSIGFRVDENPTANDVPNFPVFTAQSSGRYRHRQNIGYMWAYDDIGRPFTPVNLQRVDDPVTGRIWFTWQARDSADVWFKDILVPYTKSQVFDLTLSPSGSIFDYADVGGKVYQYRNIDRNYRSRATQDDDDTAFGNSTTLNIGWTQYGLNTNIGYLTSSTFGNPISGQSTETHQTGLYIVDRSNGLRWGSLPAAAEWPWMRGYGLHHECISGTRILP